MTPHEVQYPRPPTNTQFTTALVVLGVVAVTFVAVLVAGA
jgi:hypothetical protein